MRFGNVSKFLSVYGVRWGASPGCGECASVVRFVIVYCCCAAYFPHPVYVHTTNAGVRNRSTLTTAPQSSNACTHLHTPPGGKQRSPRGSPIDPLCCPLALTLSIDSPHQTDQKRAQRAQGSNAGRDSAPVVFSCATTPAALPSTPKLFLTVLLVSSP